MIANGLKDAQSVSLSTMWNPPFDISGGGFIEAWQKLWPNMRNSLMMVIPATIISSFIGAINGYLLSKWKFPGSDVIFTSDNVMNLSRIDSLARWELTPEIAHSAPFSLTDTRLGATPTFEEGWAAPYDVFRNSFDLFI